MVVQHNLGIHSVVVVADSREPVISVESVVAVVDSVVHNTHTVVVVVADWVVVDSVEVVLGN